MSKRAHEADASGGPGLKRLRLKSKPGNIDRLSDLSNEIILRIFSHLTIADLVLCERLSRDLRALASDGQLWKSHYYDHFVRPRARRLPTTKDADSASTKIDFAPKVLRWLDEEHLLKRGTNWKRQFKLRHNWTNGLCAVKEIPVSDEASIPPILIQMHDGRVFCADRESGLRAWSTKEHRTVAQTRLLKNNSPPTALAVGSVLGGSHPVQIVVVGFEDGSLSLWSMDLTRSGFCHRYSRADQSQGVLAAVTISWPYVATLTATQLLTLYRFDTDPRLSDGAFKEPRALHTVRSKTILPPLSVCIRLLTATVTISIAFAVPTYLSGWTVGIQEIQVDQDGTLVSSRLASAIDQHYRPLAFDTRPMYPHLTSFASSSTGISNALEFRHIHSKPNSVSYTHPYLLVTHPDNTLTLYLVASTADRLSIGPGNRLWGHTSSVSGAHVGGRGKAVSISRRGDELRVWELEGGFSSSVAKKRLTDGGLSVQIKPGWTQSHKAAPVATPQCHEHGDLYDNTTTPTVKERSLDLTLTRGWVGFDEENIVFLKEEGQGRQSLVVYDFS